MGKTKPAKSAATPVSAVKAGRVTKSNDKKSKAKEISKSEAKKAALLKKVKEATPSSDEESDAESDESESESDQSEAEAKPSKKAKSTPNGVNGVKKPAPKSDSSSEEEDSDDSESESDEEAAPAKTNGVSAKAKAKAPVDSENSSDSDSSEDDEEPKKFEPDSDASSDEEEDSDEEDDEPKKASAVNGKKAAADSDSDDSDDSEESDEEEAPKVEDKKRKAEGAAAPAAKKSKIDDEASSNPNATKNLFVGRLSWNVDDDALYEEFKEFGEIVSCRVVYMSDGKSKGFGYVEFSSVAEAVAAQQAKHEALIDGRNVNVDFAQPRQERAPQTQQDRAKKYGDVESTPTDTIFVGNISFDATYDSVKELFEQFGTITRISLPTDRESGTPKGFGYVSFGSVEEAQEAINNLRGAELAGRPVRLDFAQPRSDDGGRGGGRGGGGFGGGRGGGRGGGGFRGGRGGGFDGGRGRGGRGGGGRGGGFGGRGRGGGSTNRGGFGDFQGSKISF